MHVLSVQFFILKHHVYGNLSFLHPVQMCSSLFCWDMGLSVMWKLLRDLYVTVRGAKTTGIMTEVETVV